MDDKVKRLKQFYNSMDFTQMKLEIKDWDFNFIDTIEKACTLDYVEMKSKVHKFRLSNIPQIYYDYLLKMHIEQHGNVCGYFDKIANNVFCFNLDSTVKGDADAETEEMKSAIYILREHLREVGVEPFITKSGRGYHCWCRIYGTVPNEELEDFMRETQVRVRVTMNFLNDINDKAVSFSCYPHHDDEQRFSLRLFGSTHTRNKKFSNVVYGEGTNFTVLDEQQSWEHLAWHMYYHAMSVEKFRESAKMQHDTFFNKDKTDV